MDAWSEEDEYDRASFPAAVYWAQFAGGHLLHKKNLVLRRVGGELLLLGDYKGDCYTFYGQDSEYGRTLREAYEDLEERVILDSVRYSLLSGLSIEEMLEILQRGKAKITE